MTVLSLGQTESASLSIGTKQKSAFYIKADIKLEITLASLSIRNTHRVSIISKGRKVVVSCSTAIPIIVRVPISGE